VVGRKQNVDPKPVNVRWTQPDVVRLCRVAGHGGEGHVNGGWTCLVSRARRSSAQKTETPRPCVKEDRDVIEPGSDRMEGNRQQTASPQVSSPDCRKVPRFRRIFSSNSIFSRSSQIWSTDSVLQIDL
jgi:hypothetical protein